MSSHGPALHFLCGLDGSSAASLQPEAAGRQLLGLTQLPLRCVAFLSETSVVGAGFDGQVMPSVSFRLPLSEAVWVSLLARVIHVQPASVSAGSGGQESNLQHTLGPKLSAFCALQVFLFERDGEGVWSCARSLSPEPGMRIDGGGRRGAVSAAFSAKLAMFRSPAKKVLS